MREIKFRAWGPNSEFMWVWDEVKHCPMQTFLNDGEKIIMQFTGLTDSKGVEIYEGDVVRINVANGEYPQYSFDGLYEVQHWFRGVSFKYIKLAWEDKDANQYPIRTHITSESIYERWHDKKGCHYSELSNGKEMKSTSIEVIGNIHENPELLESTK